MTVRPIRGDRRQFYLFEGLGINSLVASETRGPIGKRIGGLPMKEQDENR